jgi:hypothetical protein
MQNKLTVNWLSVATPFFLVLLWELQAERSDKWKTRTPFEAVATGVAPKTVL